MDWVLYVQIVFLVILGILGIGFWIDLWRD